MRIVTRKSLDYLKKNVRHRESLNSVQPEIIDVEPREGNESELFKLERGIQELPKDQQMVLRLFYTQDYSLNEISDIL
ncbi:MAG: hypothetical protein MUO53_00245 [Maribacter sp.]|nr:hypothetical protein [Maribacter sp.]